MEQQKYILLVDDDEDFAKVARIYFSRSGFELRWASSGKKALKAIGTRLPDALILDVMMPKMNGIEVCRDIRAKMGMHHLPIIVLSAFPSEDVKKELLVLGADKYLTKPIGMEDLVDHVNSVIPRNA